MRRALGTLACSLALLGLALCGSAAAASGGEVAHPGGAFGLLGHTVIAGVVTATNADQAIDALGDSMVLMEAREQIADEEARAATAPEPELPTEAEIAADPSLLPPASAGTNGTTDPKAAAARSEIFAHSRSGSSFISCVTNSHANSTAPSLK